MARPTADPYTRGSLDPNALGSLGVAVAALAPRLEPEEAARAARLLLEAMGKMIDPRALRALVPAVAALVVELRPIEAQQRAGFLAAAIGGTCSTPAPLLGLAPLAEASRPLPGRFTEQQLVDLLKMPPCQRPAREVIVRQLGHQCGRPFANMWEFVDWAREHRPDLDLNSPPVRLTSP
jgi:hypothetical protein